MILAIGILSSAFVAVWILSELVGFPPVLTQYLPWFGVGTGLIVAILLIVVIYGSE